MLLEKKEESKYKFVIEEISTKDNEKIIPKNINVFVGANNCGKTQVLKDIYNYVVAKDIKKVIFSEINIEYPKSWEEMNSVYNFECGESVYFKNGIKHISPEFIKENVERGYKDVEEIEYDLKRKDKNSFRYLVGPGVITYLNTDNRLSLAKSKEINRRLSNRIPENLLEALYKAGTPTINKVAEYIEKIFKIKIYFDISDVGALQYKVGVNLSDENKNQQEIYRELKDVPILDNQGDGLKSVVGIIAALLAVRKPIILLDEPEAFLHPPQAMQLGMIISELIEDSQQIFIATHSVDFLKGLLMKSPEAQIIHLAREINDNMKVNVLDTGTLQKIVSDPLLSSTRVLDGMFYKGIVVTEGDADAAFYQKAFYNIGSADQIHFVNAHNKQTLKKVIVPYQKLGIKFAMIVDADIIRDKKEFEGVISFIEDNVKKDNLIKKREKIYEYFRKKSSYSRLRKIHDEITELSKKKIPEESNRKVDFEQIIKDYRRELGKIREESDELNELKKSGINAFDEKTKSVFCDFIEECANNGIFIVEVGELESWLEDYDVPRKNNKANWITNALMKLSEIKEIDESKEIWKFMKKIQMFLTK